MSTSLPVRPLRLGEFTRVEMTLSGAEWWSSVPARPGWYAIETNAPLSELESAPAPGKAGKNYSFPDRLGKAKLLLQLGLAITPATAGAAYVVYSGEHANLKARAREHSKGDKGTGCLCLSQYANLCNFRWDFLYLEFERHLVGHSDDKNVRTLLEQGWRAENGWPVMCSK